MTYNSVRHNTTFNVLDTIDVWSTYPASIMFTVFLGAGGTGSFEISHLLTLSCTIIQITTKLKVHE